MNKYNIIVVLVLVSAVVIVLGIKNKNSLDVEKADNTALAAVVPLPKLLELGSLTCIPCKMMAPIIDEIKSDYSEQLTVEFIDVKKDRSAGEAYGISIIPAQIFFDTEDNELFRHEGFFSKEDILAKWKELGFELMPTQQVVE